MNSKVVIVIIAALVGILIVSGCTQIAAPTVAKQSTAQIGHTFLSNANDFTVTLVNARFTHTTAPGVSTSQFSAPTVYLDFNFKNTREKSPRSLDFYPSGNMGANVLVQIFDSDGVVSVCDPDGLGYSDSIPPGEEGSRSYHCYFADTFIPTLKQSGMVYYSFGDDTAGPWDIKNIF